MLTPYEFGIKVAHTTKRAQYPSSAAPAAPAAPVAPVPLHKRVKLPPYSSKQYGDFHGPVVKALNLPADTTPEVGYQALVDAMTNGTLTPGQQAILKPMIGTRLPRFSVPAPSPAAAGQAAAAPGPALGPAAAAAGQAAAAPGPALGPAAAALAAPPPSTLTNEPVSPERAMTLDDLFGPETKATGPAASPGLARPKMQQMPPRSVTKPTTPPAIPKNVKPATPPRPAASPERFAAAPTPVQPASFGKFPAN